MRSDRCHAGDPKGQLLAWLRIPSEFKENEAERGLHSPRGDSSCRDKGRQSRRE